MSRGSPTRTLLRLVAILVAAAVFGWNALHRPDAASAPASAGHAVISQAFADRAESLQVRGEGTVVRVLRDDNDGSRHQRFIVELASGHTVLVAHNIDLAPRVEGIARGDRVEFYGEYEWNPQGGVIHWTHHDPRGRHVAGYVKHAGRTYQ